MPPYFFSFGGRWIPGVYCISSSGHIQGPILASRRNNASYPGCCHLCWKGWNLPSRGWGDLQLLFGCHLPSSFSLSHYVSFPKSGLYSLTLPNILLELDVGVEEEGQMRNTCAPIQKAWLIESILSLFCNYSITCLFFSLEPKLLIYHSA